MTHRSAWFGHGEMEVKRVACLISLSSGALRNSGRSRIVESVEIIRCRGWRGGLGSGSSLRWPPDRGGTILLSYLLEAVVHLRGLSRAVDLFRRKGPGGLFLSLAKEEDTSHKYVRIASLVTGDDDDDGECKSAANGYREI